MPRPRGSGGRSSYDKYRKFQSTGHKRSTGRAAKASGKNLWGNRKTNGSSWASKFTKKR